jgi:UDP-glucuronate 4-epimerase
VPINLQKLKADSYMKILVTGSAGFIGAALTYSLLQRGDTVIGIDNHNDYYDPSLKEARIQRFINHPNYIHIRMDIANRDAMADIFNNHKPERVVNLAAQAGVRYSLENPQAYIDSNIVGFANILEGCRQSNVEHLVYASSSSVYGANTSYPFSVRQSVDHPLSLYAATKRSNELMAHSYSHLYGLPTTGVRFFTVYGPWGRPDMALFKFAQAILEGRPIQIYNHGQHIRDFTYIDDVVHGILKVLDRPATSDSTWSGLAPVPQTSHAPYKIYNVGSGTAVTLTEYIAALEYAIGQPAKKEWLDAQPGDVPATHSDVTETTADLGFGATTPVQVGIARFVDWYLSYLNVPKPMSSP